MIALLAGCLDYGVAGKEDSPDPVHGDIDVASTVDLASVCGETETSLAIANTGDGMLTLAALDLAGAGWQVGSVPLPAGIPAGQSRELPLTAGPGSATLTIRSDDPDEGVVDVALRADEDLGPVVIITAPAEDEVLDPDADFVLKAVTSDPEDAPETLTVSWSSELTGPIADDHPDEGGAVSTDWPAAERDNGPQVVSVRVTDRCGHEAEQTLYFCQEGAHPVDTLGEDAWHVEGAAVVDQPAATLTLGPGLGAAFDAFQWFDAGELDLAFTVAGSGAGFSLTALDVARAPDDWIGGEGCGLGFADCVVGPALPGWSLAFDTLADDGNDCVAAPSIGLVTDGDLATWAGCVALGPIDDGKAHAVTVHVAAPALRVEVDGVVVVDADVAPTGFDAWVGFTGVGDWAFGDVEVVDMTCD